MSINFVLVGHVDHGKSSVGGRLLHTVHAIPDHDFEMIKSKAIVQKEERQIWSRILDTCEEEQTRGKTHEYSVVPFTYGGDNYELIDTPGHKTFIRQMIAAINGRPSLIGCLVVSSVLNEFESAFNRGSIKEHLILLRAIGIRQLVVVLNKTDISNDEWAVNIQTTLTTYIAKLNYDNVIYHKASAVTGIGIVELLANIKAVYDKTTLVGAMTAAALTDAVMVNKCIAKVYILYLPETSIITAGFIAIAYINGEECECCIEKCQTRMMRIGDTGKIELSFSNSIQLTKNAKIVLRKDDYTIGYGTCCA